MADFELELEPPSFSLGLDFDIESEPPPNSSTQPPSSTTAGCRTIEINEDEDFESPVRVSNPPRLLKRLRYGGPVVAQPKSDARNLEVNDAQGKYDLDDEIEGFSPGEDCPRAGNLPSHSICSSSKPSLHGRQVLTTLSGSLWKSTKRKEVLGASTSVSPLQRLQLIDSGSDSDNPCDGEDVCKVGCSTSSSRKMQSNPRQHAASGFFGTGQTSIGNHETDLWKDFCKEKSFHITTPAFDEVCHEFFRSRKSENEVVINGEDSDNGTKWDVGSFPPSHRYFFHDDSRIQKLVRDRLPNFFPLGAAKNQEHKQHTASVIDYMHQFSHEENLKKTYETSSMRTKKNVSKPNIIMPEDSENWVNPKGCAIPKNAGKRMVHAASKSGGHWYTNSSGQRVYVSRNGQRSSGQSAYRGYRKESGIGFKNSKKKAAGKKKTAADKKKCTQEEISLQACICG